MTDHRSITLNVESEGQQLRFDAPIGVSLMEALAERKLPIEAVCEGALACATCHVVIDPHDFDRVGPPSEDEEDMLDLGFNVTRTSRLSCQITLSQCLDDLRLKLLN